MKKYHTITKIGVGLAWYAAYKFLDTAFNAFPNRNGFEKIGGKVASLGFGSVVGGMAGGLIESVMDAVDEVKRESSCDCNGACCEKKPNRSFAEVYQTYMDAKAEYDKYADAPPEACDNYEDQQEQAMNDAKENADE